MENLDLTEFNSNKATLIRVDMFLIRCAQAQEVDNFEAYYKGILNLYKEARYKMPQDMKEKYDDKLETIRQQRKLVKAYKDDIDITADFEEYLFNFENDLRDFMGEKGMLLTDSRQGEDDIDW